MTVGMFVYAAAPVVGWVVAGSTKFGINVLRRGRGAYALIGLGGIPSTHTSVVTTTAVLVAFRQGLDSPAFAVAATLAVIVVIDATSLRRHVGRQAAALNQLLARDDDPVLSATRLRETIGHRWIEVLAGLATGICCGAALARLS